MPSSGVFVTLYDERTLALYLSRGLYGTLMPLAEGNLTRSMHYPTLSDYACVRRGTHVFFFLKRKVVYGGQVVGSDVQGAFCLNGQNSPMGKAAEAALCWDESKRGCYEPTDREGIFHVPFLAAPNDRCQPYLIRFEDTLQLKGKAIRSDDLYWRLGDYSYPLPSNSIQGMSFCTLTPAETDICLDLLTGAAAADAIECDEDLVLDGEPTPFSPQWGISDIQGAFQNGLFANEAHIEASVLANPMLLPAVARPRPGDALCRQVPVSPFKPAQMDRADICYYSDDGIKDGSVPNVVIELKKDRAGRAAVAQVERYLDWLYRIAGDQAGQIRAYVVAPSFSRTAVVEKYEDQIQVVPLINS